MGDAEIRREGKGTAWCIKGLDRQEVKLEERRACQVKVKAVSSTSQQRGLGSVTTRVHGPQHEKEKARVIWEVPGHKEVEMGRSFPESVLHMRSP